MDGVNPENGPVDFRIGDRVEFYAGKLRNDFGTVEGFLADGYLSVRLDDGTIAQAQCGSTRLA